MPSSFYVLSLFFRHYKMLYGIFLPVIDFFPFRALSMFPKPQPESQKEARLKSP